MARVITFSRFFPAYHPKDGQPTYFVEKLYNSLPEIEYNFQRKNGHFYVMLCSLNGGFSATDSLGIYDGLNSNVADKKHHTIRAGNRWKVGDKFSPRVWIGRPYNSPQFIIAPDIEVKKVWSFKLYATDKHIHMEVGGHEWLTSNGKDFDELMRNDGLSPDDFRDWFCKSPTFKRNPVFSGQIICWNDSIKY